MGTIFPDDRRAAERRRRHAQIRRRRITALVVAVAVVIGIAVFVVVATGGSGSPSAVGGSHQTSDSTGTTTQTTSTAAPKVCQKAQPPTGIHLITFKAASGDCVEPAALVRYRCPIGAAPILRVGNGSSTRRYLGGMYAMSAKRPASAAEIGQIGPSTVYETPGHVVYVSEGGHLRRWLSLPATVPGSGKRKAFLLGDSVMLGAKSEVESRLSHHWVPHMDAVVSRSTPEGLAVLQAGGAGGAPAIVLQLGTNDGGTPSLFAENVADVFKELKDTPFVVWLNIGHARSYYAEDDRIIAAEAAKHPNMTVADWADRVPKDGVVADGLHLEPSGAEAMAKLITDELDGWRSATWSPSAVSCNGKVDSAVA